MTVPVQLGIGFDAPHRNQYLFSDHYLNTLLPADPRWIQALDEATDFLTWLQTLYRQEQNQLPHYNESQLEEHWFRPILARLGHTFELQASIPGLDRDIKRPDYVFFPNEAARQAAVSSQKTSDYTSQALAVGEVKQWDVPLGKKQKGGGASFDAQNPGFQIDYYLRTTSLKWGLLSNGRLWRLVHADTSQRLSIYYEVDLVDLLNQGSAADLRYFTLFFGQAAFQPDEQGRLFLADALSASQRYAVALEEDLQQNIYQALEQLMQGFLDLPANRLSEADLPQIYQSSLYLLYRLLFVLYGESRGLLPLDNLRYRDHYSLDQLKRECASLPSLPAPMTRKYWQGLQELFRIINGDEAVLNKMLGVPRYNGGLFDPNQHPFLVEKAVGDQAVVMAINLLALRQTKSGPEFVDYRTLGVRQLGSIYEGLLEYQPRYATEPMAGIRELKGKGERWVKASAVSKGATVTARREPGQIYLETDRGERKATGSYYTPQYIVEYIAQNTLGPLVEAARARVKERAKQAKSQAAQAQAEQSLIEEILNLKALDPAMGSGHFLVEATEYLALALATDPYVEVTPGRPDSSSRPARSEGEDDLAHWRRRVVERCIYGVDKNPLAVELAKLSLWLATVAADKPLSFIDHHLKCGDALVGARVADLGAAPPVLLSKKEQQLYIQEKRQGYRQANLFEQRLSERLPVVMGKILEITQVESDSYDTVQAKEAADRAVKELKAPFEAVANLWISAYFGHTYNGDDYVAALEAIGQTTVLFEQSAIQEAQQIASQSKRNFFHWELAFPEVFYDRYGQSLGDKAGFDAVVGNPPYVSAWSMTNTDINTRSFIAFSLEANQGMSGHWDLYIPFLLKSYSLTTWGGGFSFIIPNPFCREKYALKTRRFLLEHTQIERIVSFGEENIFEAVSRQTIIPVFRKVTPDWGITKVQIDDPLRVLGVSNYKSTNYDIPQIIFHQMPEYQMRFEGRIERLGILKNIEELSIRLGDVCYVNYGAQVSSKKKGAFGKSDVISFSPRGNAKKFFDGKNLSRYTIELDGRYLDYRPTEMYGPRAPELFESPKIVVRDVTGANEQLVISYDDSGLYCDHLIICATYYENVENTDLQTNFDGFERLRPPYPDLLYMTSLLASKLVTWYFQEVFATGTLQGSYSHTYPQQIRAFPIRRISFITTAKERERLAAEARQLYAAGQSETLPAFSQARLAVQPEQADVVHDLLAFLAGQMIEMNKEKQQVAEAFWLDVEGMTDAVTFARVRAKGKQEASLWALPACQPYVRQDSHSSRTLEESLAWDEAAFKAFVKALTGSVPNLSQLVKVYQAHSPTYSQLVVRLAATDRLIDQIVYQLYDLTEEEIQIVEGKGPTGSDAEWSEPDQ